MTTSLRAADTARALAFTWIVAAVPTALVAFFLLTLAEQSADRTAGLVITALAVSGVLLGGWLLGPGRHAGAVVSWALSAAWAVAALALYPTQDFPADALWVSGVPLLGAVVTAVVAWRAR